MASFKKAFVTGADGFIGSHLVQELLAQGYNVKAFCAYNSFGKWGWLDSLDSTVKSQIEVVLGDVRDPLIVRSSMSGCDVVFHLAALIAIPYSYVAPTAYIDTNINGTLNVVQSARELDVLKVIHTSTSETYGTAQFVPITEDHPLVAQSPYAASKIGADQLALSFWRSFNTPISVLRPFNTYGPRQSSRAVIPTIISQIASGYSNIKLGALSPTRDFNFVSDTCKAFIAVAESSDTIGEVINSASGFEISIEQTASLIAEVMNVQVDISSDIERLRPHKSEVNRLFGDSSKLRSLTSWTPDYAGLDGFRKGLKLTADWFSDPVNLAHYNSSRYVV